MVSLPIIITRTEPGASETAARLREEGFSAICSPMLALRRSAHALPDLALFDHVIFTSANGVFFFRAAADDSASRLIAWCVGPSTAAAAREADFVRVMESAGDAEDLLAFILSAPEARDGQFLHVANSAAKGRLVRGLTGSGRRAVFVPLYDAVPQPSISGDAAEAMRAGPVIILAHSEKGAEAFVAAVSGEDLSESIAVAISERAAAPLRRAGCGQTVVAEAPNEEALLAALRHLC